MPKHYGDKNTRGVKPGTKSKLVKYKPEQVVRFKMLILDKLESGEAFTLSEAANQIGIMPVRAYSWSKYDPDFREMIALARQVRADRLEMELTNSNNIVAKIFILKGLRPEFRENYKVEVSDTRFVDLLEELRRLGREPHTITFEEPLKLLGVAPDD